MYALKIVIWAKYDFRKGGLKPMGKAYSYKCDKCSHVETMFTGIGFRYPSMLEELKAEILEGKYGTTAEKALKENPEASVKFEDRIYRCPNCGKVENKKHIVISFPDEKKVRVRYRCERGCPDFLVLMARIPESMKCPKCSGTLHIDLKDIVLWD